VSKILVTYVTHSGTTKDVAEAISKELSKTGIVVETLPIDKANPLSDYSAVVLGAPMIMGWHRKGLRFLRQHHTELAQMPLAIFVTAMSLTRSRVEGQSVNIYLDERLVSQPKNEKRLTFKERYTTVKNYLRPITRNASDSLVSVGLFGGRLDLYRLKWWEALFVMFIIGAKPGEKRNWPGIQAWATSLPALLVK
jgi:menaquinone-dependent protoporphyrinogen IX oxidase